MQKQSPISEFLKDKMREANVTPKELAKTLGFQRSFPVESWIKAKSLPPLNMLAPIARALKASTGELLVVWVMTQDLDLALSLKEETVRKMPASKRRALIRKVLAEPGRAITGFDPIDEGEPGDDP